MIPSFSWLGRSGTKKSNQICSPQTGQKSRSDANTEEHFLHTLVSFPVTDSLLFSIDLTAESLSTKGDGDSMDSSLSSDSLKKIVSDIADSI